MYKIRTKIVMLAGVLVGVTMLGIAQPVHASSVNDFTITNYTIDYSLSRDASRDNRSILKTTETITADFPQTDQNHGIERAIPEQYDHHPVGLTIDSVKDQSGVSLNYSTYESNGNKVVRIGSADYYVHGLQTYVITYTQTDVTKFFSNTNDDEFYWDANGTEWSVPIENLSVTLHVDDTTAQSLTDKASCYQGAAGSTANCTLLRTGNEYHVQATNLMSRENVTIAIGFKPHTFGVYKESLFDQIKRVAIISWMVLSVFGFGLVVWLSILSDRVSNRKKEVGTIVPEYIPPKDESVTVSASIISGTTKTFAAQLIDFAVRHYVRIYEIEKKSIFGSKDYEIEIIRDISDLHAEEQEILQDIFPGNVVVGSRLTMSSLQNSSSVALRTMDNDKKLNELVRGPYALRAKDKVQSRKFKTIGWVLLVLGLVFVSPFILFASLWAFVTSFTLYPLTDKGLVLYRYLEGLKMYIKVAEMERLKMIQSPDGAEKVGAIDPNDPKQLVKLYERVLPYAILFGQETEWNKRLGAFYESTNSQPDWYSGNTAFNAIAFSSAMSSFSTASSYTSASSSSSGGSSGGGSSGGGGGGGGGGGW